jgi:hypothetical protein
MKTLVVFPTGSLSQKDKERMSREGYLAIESDDPSKVIIQLPVGAVNADTLTLCALEAMSGQTSTHERAMFTTLLYQALKEKKAVQ